MWFTQSDSKRIQRGNAIDWLLWALFSTHIDDALDEWQEELEQYLSIMSNYLGYSFDLGSSPDVQIMRLTLDPVVMVHRPLVWYIVSIRTISQLISLTVLDCSNS